MKEGIILVNELSAIDTETLLGVLLEELGQQTPGERGHVRGEGELLVENLAVHLVGVFRVEGGSPVSI